MNQVRHLHPGKNQLPERRDTRLEAPGIQHQNIVDFQRGMVYYHL